MSAESPSDNRESKSQIESSSILIVDDEDTILDILEEHLAPVAGKVFKALSGREALDALEKNSIDLAFLDLMMPEMSGIELLKIIREKYPEVVIIVLTAHLDRETATEASKFGTFDFIDKPFEKRTIVNSAKAALNYRATHMSVPAEKQAPTTEKSIQILAVCNERELIVLFNRLFSTLDCKTRIEGDLDGAKKALETLPPDILLLDIDISKQMALELVKKLRDCDPTHNAHIIMISDVKDDFVINAAFMAGVDDYILKPVRPIQLKQKVKLQITRFLKKKDIPTVTGKSTNTDNTRIEKNERELETAFQKIRTLEENLKEEVQGKRKLADMLKESSNKGTTVPDDGFKKTIDEKEKTIDKLSVIIQKRSKVSSSSIKEKKAFLDQSKTEETSITKLKTDGKKEILDKQKSEIENRYKEIEEVIACSTSEIMELLIGIESSTKNKDNIIDNALRRIGQFYDTVAKELYKTKKLYHESKDDKEALDTVEIIEGERAQKMKDFMADTMKQISGAGGDLTGRADEVRSGLTNIEDRIKSLIEELNRERANYEKTEREWLFLLQDHFKGKYFDLLDRFNELLLDLEEKEVTTGLFEKKLKSAENTILFLREKNGASKNNS